MLARRADTLGGTRAVDTRRHRTAAEASIAECVAPPVKLKRIALRRVHQIHHTSYPQGVCFMTDRIEWVGLTSGVNPLTRGNPCPVDILGVQ